MAEPLGLLASCITVAGLGLRVAHTTENWIARWHDADNRFRSLNLQCQALSTYLNELAEWMKAEYLQSSASKTFVRSLALSVSGCMRILLTLKDELESLEIGPGPMRKHKRAWMLFQNSRLTEVQQHLDSQTSGLRTILAMLVIALPSCCGR